MTRGAAVVSAVVLISAGVPDVRDVPDAAAGPKSGRIVRVERPRTGTRGTPRVCRLTDLEAGNCWGRPPSPGEIGTLLGPRVGTAPGNRGQVRIVEVNSNVTGAACSMPESWSVKLAPLDTNLKDLEVWSTWVLIDVEVGPGAAITDTDKTKVPDEYGANETAWLALDRDLGDASDEADFLIMAYGCDESGSRVANTDGYCLDYWARGLSQWTKLRKDVVVPHCGP